MKHPKELLKYHVTGAIKRGEKTAVESVPLKTLDESSIELDGIDTSDYPDFCDAFVSYARWSDGSELTDAELEKLNENGDLIHDLVFKHLF